MSDVEKGVLESNASYVKSFKAGGLPLPPSKHAAFITCMDARLDPAASYGFNPGEVTVIRTAGAVTKDAIRSALICSHLLGVREFYVVKHTRCGLLGATTEMAHEVMKKNLGTSVSKDIEAFEPFPIQDLKESAHEDVQYMRTHPLMQKDIRITGWIHDTDTGAIEKVVD